MKRDFIDYTFDCFALLFPVVHAFISQQICRLSTFQATLSCRHTTNASDQATDHPLFKNTIL